MREPNRRTDADVAGFERFRSLTDEIWRDTDVGKFILFGECAFSDYLCARHIGIENRMFDMSRQLRTARRGILRICASAHLLIYLFCYFLYNFVDVHFPYTFPSNVQ